MGTEKQMHELSRGLSKAFPIEYERTGLHREKSYGWVGAIIIAVMVLAVYAW